MSRLVETTVQAEAIKYLVKRYRPQGRKRKIFAQAEVRTKKKHGSKRADGLLAFRHWLWGTYVVSLEAKSYKTLPAIKPKLDRQLYAFNIFKVALAITVASGAFFFLYRWDDGFFQFIVPGTVFLLSGAGYAWWSKGHYRHRTLKVVQQITQYPADDRWLAFSKDAFNDLSLEKQDQLRRICRYRGIGLLVVAPNEKPALLARPKFHWDWWHDYLRFYSKEKEIRKQIA